jgi:hypothetical protein
MNDDDWVRERPPALTQSSTEATVELSYLSQGSSLLRNTLFPELCHTLYQVYLSLSNRQPLGKKTILDEMKTSMLNDALSDRLSKRKSRSTLRVLSTAPDTSVDFSSNDYLSLSKSSLLKTAYLQELETCQDFRLGSSGSRLLVKSP